MSLRSAQSITVEFCTARFDTGAATDADSTPGGTAVLNGTDNGASVTVTKIDTGRYKAAFTTPTLAIGDILELYVSATVNSVAAKNIVWRDTCDLVINSSGQVAIGGTQGTPTFTGIVTGFVNNTGNITFAGAVALSSTLTVSGALTLASAKVTGNTTFGGNISAAGSTSFVGNVGMAAGITIAQSVVDTPGLSVTGNGAGMAATFSGGIGSYNAEGHALELGSGDVALGLVGQNGGIFIANATPGGPMVQFQNNGLNTAPIFQCETGFSSVFSGTVPLLATGGTLGTLATLRVSGTTSLAGLSTGALSMTSLSNSGAWTQTGAISAPSTSNTFAGGIAHVGTVDSTGINAIADQVWDEATSGHSTAGSTGKALIDASTGGIDTADLAQDVWQYTDRSLTSGVFRVTNPWQQGTLNILKGATSTASRYIITKSSDWDWPTDVTAGYVITLTATPTDATLVDEPTAPTFTNTGNALTTTTVNLGAMSSVNTDTLVKPNGNGANAYTYRVAATKTGELWILETGVLSVG